MVRRQVSWRWLLWYAGVLWSCGCLLTAVIVYLIPTPQLLYPSPIYGIVYRGTLPLGRAALNWRGDHWEGRASQFPPATTTHFFVNPARSFFVVHLADGRLLALSDRATHRGQRVYWYPSLPGSTDRYGEGFRDHDAGTIYLADGQRRAGPARRDLDPYPVSIIGAEVRIAARAVCPDDGVWWYAWCR